MVASKLQNADEIRRWYREGRTYAWIVEEYKRKYNIEIVPSTVSNWRVQLGLTERRISRADDLIPWTLKREHRFRHAANMLRAETQRREGKQLTETNRKRLERWLKWMKENDAVVLYDPNTEQGFWYVKRDPGVDDDLIRRPARPTRRRSRE